VAAAALAVAEFGKLFGPFINSQTKVALLVHQCAHLCNDWYAWCSVALGSIGVDSSLPCVVEAWKERPWTHAAPPVEEGRTIVAATHSLLGSVGCMVKAQSLLDSWDELPLIISMAETRAALFFVHQVFLSTFAQVSRAETCISVRPVISDVSAFILQSS
jgi:hypothetical protein